MIKVAFICTHNSCRSQIAEALANELGRGVLQAYSAGTDIKDEVNKDAIRLVKELYSIDMSHQKPKLLGKIPRVDYAITMGCGVECPFLPSKFPLIEWNFEDPTGKNDDEFIKTIKQIEQKVREFIAQISL